MNAKDGDMNTLRCAALTALLLTVASPRLASAQDAPSSNNGVSLLGDSAPPATPTILAPAPEPFESEELGMPLGRPVERAPLPRPEDESETGVLGGIPVGELIRVGGALAIVLGLLLVVRMFMRRSGGVAGGGRPSGVLEVLARYPLGKGHQLLLIKLTRRVLLVHQGGGNMTTLSEIVDPDEVAALLSRIEAGSRGPAAAKFGSLLKRYQRDHGSWPQSAGASAARGDRPVPEVVDLTRLPSRVSGGLGRRGAVS